VPSPPPAPDYYPVEFQAPGSTPASVPLYCLDAENAKNLLMNRELDKGYQDEMKNILFNLKGKDK